MPFDEKFQNALLQSLSGQRNAAHDTSAQIEASLSVVIVENGTLKAKLAELEPQLEDARKSNAELAAKVDSYHSMLESTQAQLSALQAQVAAGAPPQA